MKIRAFRKSRRNAEIECINELMNGHNNEILAIGQTLASNGALSVSSATAELRVAIQAQRNQVMQLQAFIETMRSASTTNLPPNAKFVIGVRQDDVEPKEFKDLDEVLNEMYRSSREMSETSLSEALSKMFFNTEKPDVPRHFCRRAAERESANELTANSS